MASVAVSGSIATDHLMRFPGRFADHLLPDRLDRVSLSFLVDDLVIRRGGVAANISYGLGQLGLAPVLVGAAGSDFADYRSWLEQHGVDCTNVLLSKVSHTARFVCTTDEDLCQIASFYPGAMVEAADIRLDDVIIRSGRPDLVLVCADSPAAMMHRAQECRRLGLPYAADPSQQLPRMSAVEVLEFVRGAWCLITNEYEAALLRSKTGCGEEELLTSIEMIVTTLGENGVRIATRHGEPSWYPLSRRRRSSTRQAAVTHSGPASSVVSSVACPPAWPRNSAAPWQRSSWRRPVHRRTRSTRTRCSNGSPTRTAVHRGRFSRRPCP